MSAITTQKALLAGLLVGAGVPVKRVALNNEEAAKLLRAAEYPHAKIISGTARFEGTERREAQIVNGLARTYKQVRCKLVQPFVVHVFGLDEASSTGLIESFIEGQPYYWEYKGLQGLIEPKRCEHSDVYGNMNGRYESALELEFEIDLGPDAIVGKGIQGIEQGE